MEIINLERGLLVPIGAPASGKTTLARKLIASGMNASAFIGWDATRLEVCPQKPCACPEPKPGCLGGEECYCQNAKVSAIVTRRLERQAKASDFFYLDGLNLKTSSWKKHLKLAHDHQLKATALLMEVLPLETLAVRNASRSRQVPDEFLETSRNLHKGISPEFLLSRGFDHVFQVSDLTEFKL